jgi:hypothetical protein
MTKSEQVALVISSLTCLLGIPRPTIISRRQAAILALANLSRNHAIYFKPNDQRLTRSKLEEAFNVQLWIFADFLLLIAKIDGSGDDNLYRNDCYQDLYDLSQKGFLEVSDYNFILTAKGRLPAAWYSWCLRRKVVFGSFVYRSGIAKRTAYNA